MLEARMVQASLLKKVVDAIKDLVSDATFEFSDTGLHLQSMDSSHVSLVCLTIQSDGFDFYRCDKNQSLSLSLTNLAKVLRCANNEDTLTLKAKDDSDVLSLLIENKEMNRIVDFDLKLMDIDVEQLEIPDTEYTTSIKISSVDFKKIAGDLIALGDTCEIKCKKNSVSFSVEGDVGNANITLRPGTAADDQTRTQIEVEEPISLRFALRYINMFIKATPLSSMVELKIAEKVPLVIEYQIESSGSITFYLAPKVEGAEEEET